MIKINTDNRHLQFFSKLWHERLILIAGGIGLTMLAAVLTVFQPKFLQESDLLIYDLMVAGRTAPSKSAVPVIVGVDEASLAAFGQWPWPRYRLAALVERLQQLGAQVIAMDILMPEPDRSSPEVVQAERQRDLGDGKAEQALAMTDSNSQLLADVLQKSPTVLGYYLNFLQTTQPALQQGIPTAPHGMTVVSPVHSTDSWPEPQGLIRSLPVLTAAASAEGFTNALVDIDGTLRRVPLLLAPQKQIRPSLAMAALLLYSTERKIQLTAGGGDALINWGQHSIPVDGGGNMMVDYRSSQPAYYSARAVMNNEVAAGSLQGKIVLVGAWAKGLQDVHLTPSGKWINGLEVHATIIDNVLSGTFISRPDWARGVELFVVLLLGVLCTLVLSRAGFAVSLLILVLAAFACYVAASQLLIRQGIHLSPLMPILTLVLITSVMGLLKYAIEARKLLMRTQELMEAQDGIIVSMSALSEARDNETGGHILRTQNYVEILARQLSTTAKYAYLKASDIELLAKSAPLHDIGKVGIPDSILQKPGKLTEDEYKIMQSHPLIGADALTKIVTSSKHPDARNFLHYAHDMIISHHERWDGQGYPQRLSGADIPLAGRLMALADVYDALVSKRVYKEGMEHTEVFDYIKNESGKHFDPDVVAAFVARNKDFLKISLQYADDVAE
jgi:adenylate cyclase